MSPKTPYRTAPEPSEKMPRGIPYIIGNEAAERYSFYGMRAILVVFMTKFLLNAQGELDVMTEEQAKTWFHWVSTRLLSKAMLLYSTERSISASISSMPPASFRP